MLPFRHSTCTTRRPSAIGGSTIALGRFLFCLLLCLFAVLPARAQEIYTSPQTVDANLATNLACTGSPQTFTTGVTPGFSNLGQTQHYLSVSNVTSANKFQAEIDGIDNQGNVYRISDMLEFPGSLTIARQGLVYGSGRFANIRVTVLCSPGGTATFSATYSGTSSTPNLNAGAYLSAQIEKVNFFAASTTGPQSDTFQTPFGNSAGTILFAFASAGVSSPAITVICNVLSGNSQTLINTVPLNGGTLAVQPITIPPAVCPTMQIIYAGAGGGTTFTAETVFTPPGTAQPSADPCKSPTVLPTSAVITAPAAATTQIVAGVTGQQIYVCGFHLGVVVAVSGTYQWTSGTGGTCGATTVTKTGAIPINTAEPVTYGPGSTLFTAASGSGVCLTLTGAGDNAAGILTFVQQ
jgi:hypothetical protein